MKWRELVPSPSGTHHLQGQSPAYAERFECVLKFHEPGLAPVRRRGQAWHITPEGQAAYAERFLQTFGFYDGLAAVVAEEGWHHILANGLPAYRSRHAWCGNFQEERCTVRNADGSYAHILRDGCCVSSHRWRYAGDFRDGVAVVQRDDGRSTHIDMSGNVVHARWFFDLDVFHKGFARAQDDEGWHHVDARGHAAYSRRFSNVEPFYNGQARVTRIDGGLEVIDETGVTVVELRSAMPVPHGSGLV